MTEKEKQHIKDLGTVYVRTNEKFMGCGSGYHYDYEPIDIISYLEQQEYNEKLNTYMKYRDAQRYSKEHTCSGSYMIEDTKGEYVKKETGSYLNITALEGQLKPEDIERRVNKLKCVKYKDFIKFSLIPMEGGKYFAYVEDPNGNYIYNKDAQKFIDISK